MLCNTNVNFNSRNSKAVAKAKRCVTNARSINSDIYVISVYPVTFLLVYSTSPKAKFTKLIKVLFCRWHVLIIY